MHTLWCDAWTKVCDNWLIDRFIYPSDRSLVKGNSTITNTIEVKATISNTETVGYTNCDPVTKVLNKQSNFF